MKLTKIDSAKQQLETAVDLFFHNRDPVSTHTLTCAGYNILKDICDQKGLKHYTIKNLELIRPERQKEYVRIINEPENHFKHADKDPDKILEFNPQITEVILFDAINTYHNIIGGQLNSFLMGTFKMWFIMKYPELLKPEHAQVAKNIKDLVEKYKVNIQDKAEFMKLATKAWPFI